MGSIVGAQQTFEFDLGGYCIFPRFLSENAVAHINRVLDRAPEVRQPPKLRNFMALDPVFLDLMADPRVLDICFHWIHEYFRFDHAWGVEHSADCGGAAEDLHGGPYSEQGSFQYHWHAGRPTCAPLNFCFVLEPQKVGEGGLVVVPGSHKSHIGLSGWDVYNEFLHKRLAQGTWIVQPELAAGDLLVFAEATMHGTARWRPRDGRRRRRNLYYKYGYGFTGYMPEGADERQQLRALARNDTERMLLRPCYVSSSGSEVVFREPTHRQLEVKTKDRVRRVRNAARSALASLRRRSGMRGGVS